MGERLGVHTYVSPPGCQEGLSGLKGELEVASPLELSCSEMREKIRQNRGVGLAPSWPCVPGFSSRSPHKTRPKPCTPDPCEPGQSLQTASPDWPTDLGEKVRRLCGTAGLGRVYSEKANTEGTIYIPTCTQEARGTL